MPIKRLKNLTFPPVIFTLSGAPLASDHGAVVREALLLCSVVLLAVSLRQQGSWSSQGRTSLVLLLVSLFLCTDTRHLRSEPHTSMAKPFRPF